MIKKLRIRFVVITMIIVMIILTALMSIINVINFKRTTDNADDILQILSYNDGVFAPDFKPIPQKPSKPKDEASSSTSSSDEEGTSSGEESTSSGDETVSSGEGSSTDQDESSSEELIPTPDHITIETPFETRYFSVKFLENGAIADTTHISSFTEAEAIEIAKSVLVRGVVNGYYESYRFIVDEEKSLVIFIDWTRQLETVENFRSISILSAICVAIVVFLLVIFLSARVVMPIAESYERQRRFISDASHELKTPLTIISANNELIELTEGESDYTASISKQVIRMTNMVKNLSSLANIDESAKSSKMASFSISRVCDEVCELFKPVLTRDNRKFEHNIDRGLDFFGDEALIRQLISSLLENASKYALSFTSLSLSLVGKRIHLEIENDAQNVEQGSLNRCFERFYRSDEARASSIEGSGIGLCVAEEIVTLHGGQISAQGTDNIFSIKVIL